MVYAKSFAVVYVVCCDGSCCLCIKLIITGNGLDMNGEHIKRLKSGLATAAVLAVVAWLVVDAMDEGLNLYVTPSSLDNRTNQQVYLGGRVVPGSIEANQAGHQFQVADDHNAVRVHYSGTLPTMFQAGRDTVVVGKWEDGQFYAKKVLAKHDEYYRPKVKNDS